MKDTETGVTVAMAVQSKPRNPRTAEHNLFQIVTWRRGLGDPHHWRSRDHFLSSVQPQHYLIYRLQKNGDDRQPTLTLLRDNETPCIGFAFASYDLLRLELGVETGGVIGSGEVGRAEEKLLVELLTYEEYVSGHVYAFRVFNAAGVLLEERGNIYGEEYAEHCARTAFEEHRLGIIAGDR